MSSEANPDACRSLLLVAGVVLSLLMPGLADAQDINEVRDAYTAGEYQRIVDLLQPLVGSEQPAISDEYLIQDFRRYLGAAYVLVDREDDGINQFRWLLEAHATDPATGRLLRERLEGFPFDPARFIEETQTVFRRVREELLRRADQQQADVQATAAERREACVTGFQALRDLASTNRVEVENDELPTWLPFGVGQFANGDETLGYAMAISQAAFALGAFGLGAAFSIVYDIGTTATGRRLPGYQQALDGIFAANVITASIFVVLAAAGIIEARTSWRPTRTVTRDREIPEELRDPVHLCGSPEAGMALCF